jgi:hypothetical protein
MIKRHVSQETQNWISNLPSQGHESNQNMGFNDMGMCLAVAEIKNAKLSEQTE